MSLGTLNPTHSLITVSEFVGERILKIGVNISQSYGQEYRYHMLSLEHPV